MIAGLARLAMVVVGLACVAVLVVLMALRARTPFALEWQEGGMLQHVERVLAGQPLYTAPSPQFIPFPYPPLFAWAGALASELLGTSLFALRVVSVVSTLLALAALVRLGHAISGRLSGGWLAAGLFAACYRFTGAWLDLARVDSLSLALVLAGLALLVRREGLPGPAHIVFAGLAFALATLAKQNAAAVGVACALGLACESRGRALVFAGSCFVPLAAAGLALEGLSHGWFSWTVFTQLSTHEWHRPALWGTWLELAVELPLALALPLLAAFVLRDPRPGLLRPVVVGACLGLLFAAWVGRVHAGGYDNTLLPAAAAAALLFGPSAAQLAARSTLSALAVLALVTAQLAWLAFDPREVLPDSEHARQAEAIVAALREVEGPVLAPYCPELARSAGWRESGAHAMAIIDLLRAGNEERSQAFVDELELGFAGGRWGALLVRPSWEQDLPLLSMSYVRAPQNRGVFALEPVTGAVQSPLWLYVRRE